MHGQRLVDGAHGQVVPTPPVPAPVAPGVRPAELVLGEPDQKLDEEYERGYDERAAPVWEPLHGDVLDVPGRPEAAHVHGGEAARADQRGHGRLGGQVVAGHQNLHENKIIGKIYQVKLLKVIHLFGSLYSSALERVRRQHVEGLDHLGSGGQGLQVLGLRPALYRTRIKYIMIFFFK